MIIQPKVRGFICTTAHPLGCARYVQEQIDYVQTQPPLANGPKKVLIIGASTGYGLSSRVVAGFGSQAATLGVFFERPAEGKRTATAGWYNSVAFHKAAQQAGLYAKSINGDAFSDEIKNQTMEIIKRDLGSIDLLIYSLAAPRRVHPRTGEISKSTLKPIGASYTNKSIDFDTDEVIEVTLPPASAEEVKQTVSVMGGKDWQMWFDALENAGLMAPHFLTVAYSYIGPEITTAVYRNGTIGKAKDHLEATAKKLDQRLKPKNGRALISVNKALVTQSSSAIPFIPLYFILLNKVMNELGINEGCIEQMYRLFSSRLYNGGAIPLDHEGRIRIDDFELREDVQKQVKKLWQEVHTGNVRAISDIEGYKKDFLKLFGFGFNNIEYSTDINPEMDLP